MDMVGDGKIVLALNMGMEAEAFIPSIHHGSCVFHPFYVKRQWLLPFSSVSNYRMQFRGSWFTTLLRFDDAVI